MRAFSPLALVILVAIAGCTAKPQEATKVPDASCGQRFAGPAGMNAALIGTLQDDLSVVAERIASVAGDTPAGAPEALQDGSVRFPTTRGNATVTRAGDETFYVASARWEGAPEWDAASPRDAAARLLEAFQFPLPSVELGDDGVFVQEHAGEPIVEAGGWARVGARAGLAIGPLFDIDGAELVAPGVAEATAREYASCAWEKRESGLKAEAAGLGVRDASLTRVILVRDPDASAADACGGTLEVHVDAVTRSVRTAAAPARCP